MPPQTFPKDPQLSLSRAAGGGVMAAAGLTSAVIVMLVIFADAELEAYWMTLAAAAAAGLTGAAMAPFFSTRLRKGLGVAVLGGFVIWLASFMLFSLLVTLVFAATSPYAPEPGLASYFELFIGITFFGGFITSPITLSLAITGAVICRLLAKRGSANAK